MLQYSTLVKGHIRSSLSSCDQVLLAPLRTGHCRHLAAYRNIIDSSDTVCRKCGAAPHTLEHWLQECLTTAAQRLLFLGSTDPPLSVLVLEPNETFVYTQETLS